MAVDFGVTPMDDTVAPELDEPDEPLVCEPPPFEPQAVNPAIKSAAAVQRRILI